MKVQQTYDVPFSVETTYAAWVSSDTVIAPATRMDIEPVQGGHYRLFIESPEFSSKAEGQFSLVEPNSHVRYSWHWDGSDETTEIDVSFAQTEDGCEIRLTHSGFLTRESHDNHASGWDSYVQGLISYLRQRHYSSDDLAGSGEALEQ